MSRGYQRLIALILLVLQGVLAAIILATPASLGLPPTAIAWGAIINVGVGIALNRLPTLWQPEPDSPARAISPNEQAPVPPRG